MSEPEAVPSALPERATEAYARFEVDLARTYGFLGFVAELAMRADDVQRTAIQALRDEGWEQKLERLGPIGSPHGVVTTRLRETFGQMLLQVTHSRGVDNFLTYVSELLALIFTTRPETLKSSESVRVDEVLSHPTMDELIAWLADRRVYRISFQGMEALAQDIGERHGFDLFEDDDQLITAIRVVETRNLIAHNQGIVNRIFLSRVRGADAREGELLKLDVDGVMSDIRFLGRAAASADQRASEKFGLPQPVERVELESRLRAMWGTASATEQGDTGITPNDTRTGD